MTNGERLDAKLRVETRYKATSDTFFSILLCHSILGPPVRFQHLFATHAFTFTQFRLGPLEPDNSGQTAHEFPVLKSYDRLRA